MSHVKITINSQEIMAKDDMSILNAARANGIYIPALCFLTRTSASMACKLCMVDVDGKRVYACNAKVKEGMNITVTTPEISADRQKIMEGYCVNHPLQCGVCDRSGECELQDNVLFQNVRTQMQAIKDTHLPSQVWGNVKYDPSLCIVCKRCISVCKEVIGDDALELKNRGGDEIDETKYNKDTMGRDPFGIWKGINKSIIGRKSPLTDEDSCGDCGECSAVCPTGALAQTHFQYTSNAWELEKIPSACVHCSGACHLWFETKQTSIDDTSAKIYRVTNDFHFQSLCAAGRFGYDYENRAKKDEKAFKRALEAFKEAKTIHFSSMITNEEAFILQKLKEKYNKKLYNPVAKNYQDFLKNFAHTSGNTLYSSDKDEIFGSDFIVCVGTNIKSDNPGLRAAINNAVKMNKGACLYFHPIIDPVVNGMHKNIVHMKHKVGAEEAIVFLLFSLFCSSMPDKLEKYLSKMTSADLFEYLDLEDSQEAIMKLFKGKTKPTMIIGEDFLNHPNNENLAHLLGMFERLTPFRLLIVPPKLNCLGVSLICDLDDQLQSPTIGYNEEADFTLTNLGAKNKDSLDMPALNQQEGTVVNMDKRLVPINAALNYDGFSLGDLASALDVKIDYTAQLTKELPTQKGFKKIDFDELENEFAPDGTQNRGYIIEPKTTNPHDIFKELTKTKKCKTLVYRANPIRHFNALTAKSHILSKEPSKHGGWSHNLYASKTFLDKHSLKNGDKIRISNINSFDNFTVLEGTMIDGEIALIPDFLGSKIFASTDYRFKEVKIERLEK